MMAKKTEQVADTVDCEHDGYEDDSIEDDDDAIETKYEKLRDDQMNTGVISALLGGFALTNSWEMEVAQGDNTIYVAAYCLAILAVHACTCSALISAFLYRALTQQSTCRKGVEWMERHSVLQMVPWYKFLCGTLCYVISVCLVAWSTLEVSTAGRTITLLAGLIGCSFVLYTCWTIYTDFDPDDTGPEISSKATSHASASKKASNTMKRRRRRRIN